MRRTWCLYGAGALGALMAGALTQASGCGVTEPSAGTYGLDAGLMKVPDVKVVQKDTGMGGVNQEAGFTWTPGNGQPCKGPVGGFPASTCDPSDESAMGCMPYGGLNGCDGGYSPQCGDLKTCEPFVTNPVPDTDGGVDNFRMRIIALTAPPALANTTIQDVIVTPAVSLPSTPPAGAACGESSGTGLFNWLLSVDKSKGTVTTGGSPPSTDPFNVGFCYINGTAGGQKVSPITLPATFTGNTFSTAAYHGVLNIPIFLAPKGVVILPITAPALNDVTMSPSGDCIGAINLGANSAANSCANLPGQTTGVGSCSLWHTAGSFGGYITLQDADTVLVQTLNETLCVLLAGAQYSNGASPQHCKPAAFSTGNYCSAPDAGAGHACSNGDSFWLSAQFAASAVAITSAKGTDVYQGSDLCNGGTY